MVRPDHQGNRLHLGEVDNSVENEGVDEDLGYNSLRDMVMSNHRVCMIQPVSKDHRRIG